MDIQRDPCPQCSALPGPYKVLMGWQPCRCGGHMYRYCRDDKGGCGHTLYDPPLQERCADPVDRALVR